MDKIVRVNNDEYEIVRLLGHGKGGYSYLALSNGKEVVLKQIHHEPCEYYAFGNKIEADEVPDIAAARWTVCHERTLLGRRGDFLL